MKELENNSLIVVSNLVENEDGSATMTIDTTREATEFLVQEGLVSVLEKAIDKENTDYSIDKSLLKGEDDEQETSST
jgi:hypothetical protein